MKKEKLIGLHCHTSAVFGPTGTVKRIFKDEEGEWQVEIDDDGDINYRIVEEVIFDIPYCNRWEFDYLNSRWEIDGDERFIHDSLWLDSKISKDEAVDIISKLFAGSNFFSLKNLKIGNQLTYPQKYQRR